MDADILVENCIVVAMDGRPPITDGAIAIKGDKIVYVGKAEKAGDIKAETRIDARGMVALPGLINCHTHVPMTLLRGIAEDQPLEKWLRESIWPIEAKLTDEDVYYGTLLGCIEMIKGGTTCFADMYFHVDAMAKAIEEVGIRAAIAPGIIELGFPETGIAMLEDAVKFAERWHGKAEGRIVAQLGPHAPYTCGPELLMKAKQEAERLGIFLHIHLAESVKEVKDFNEKHGKTEFEFLEEIGFLGPKVLAAHCVQLTDKDMEIISKHGVKVAYNPTSNAKLGNGIARAWELHQLGVDVGLATDGPASNNTLDMVETLRWAALLQKAKYQDSTVMPLDTVLEMATIGGARVLGLEGEVGSLEPGKKADVILIDLKKPHLTPVHNVKATIVYSAKASDVDTVIIDGRLVMRNRRILTVDEEAVREKTGEISRDLMQR